MFRINYNFCEKIRLKQELEEFESKVSLPKKRSRATKENNYYYEKNLSDSQKTLLEIHDKTNWINVELTQAYKTPKGIMKEIFWKLPSTQEKKETCGKFKTLGCFNLFSHPKNQALIQHTKLSCFRSACEYCWLEKWLARESTRATKRIHRVPLTFVGFYLTLDCPPSTGIN